MCTHSFFNLQILVFIGVWMNMQEKMTCNLLISILETSNETLPLDQDHNCDTMKCYKTFEKLFRMGLGEDNL